MSHQQILLLNQNNPNMSVSSENVSTPLTDKADVLVIGAGPAGSATAITLARLGLSVTMIDQYDFPRDKTCGDGLIPDSLKALEVLGVLDAVLQRATKVQGLACHGPAGQTLYIPGDLAVLPRKELDHILVMQARQAGARLLTPVKFVKPAINAAGRVIGAEVLINGESKVLTAKWVVLATGASAGPLRAAGVCERPLPSAMALRAYVHNPQWAGRIEHLEISWHKSYAPGYGWIFPCGNGLFNVGVGLYGMHQKTLGERLLGAIGRPISPTSKRNLHDLFDRFVQSSPAAQDLLGGGKFTSEIKGAPLRCSLEGALSERPGMLVTGEAIGSTYALTGEGIGKAMETGILAAQAIAASPQSDATVAQTYRRSLDSVRPKFAIYQKANIINRMPWLINLAIRRGNASPRLVNRMSLVLEEKANPARLFTLKGAWKFLTE